MLFVFRLPLFALMPQLAVMRYIPTRSRLTRLKTELPLMMTAAKIPSRLDKFAHRLQPHRLPARSMLSLALALTLFTSSCVTALPTAATNRGSNSTATSGSGIKLSTDQRRKIGNKIWQNECSGTVAGLTSWNQGEDFASLGIGHFIWDVPGRPAHFDESFPKLIAYMKANRVQMPVWLATQRGCPWNSYADFHAAKNSARMVELRNFLANTIDIQTGFIVQRLEQALPKMIAATPDASRKARLRATFYAVAESPQGVYALIDYVNFKGEGIEPGERYNGQGWGMRDVLLEMRGQPRGAAAAIEYSEAAKRVLNRRIANAPAARNEAQWRAGWMNRCETYKRGI